MACGTQSLLDLLDTYDSPTKQTQSPNRCEEAEAEAEAETTTKLEVTRLRRPSLVIAICTMESKPPSLVDQIVVIACS